jgi:hypothetical protein
VNAKAVRSRYGATELPGFERSDVVRHSRNWKEKTRATFTGIRELQTTPSGYQVELNYLFQTPEGRYEVGMSALGHDDPTTGVRDWQINFNRSGIRRDVPNSIQHTRLGRLCEELEYECMRRFLPEWTKQLNKSSESLEGLLRVNGAAPAQELRAKLAQELKAEYAINVFPGNPMAPAALPEVDLRADDVRLINRVEMNAPSLGGVVPANVVVQVKGDELVKELLKLQGPGWDQQAVQAEWPLQLPSYKFSFQVVEIDARPGAPREGPQIRTTQPGGPGG